MAADGSFTQMLFFIAAIVVAVSVSGVLIAMSNSMAHEIKDKTEAMSEEMGTSISIVNDPRHMPYADDVLTVYLKNIGDISLKYNGTIILIDGQYIDGVTIVSGSAASWPVGSTMVVQAHVALAAGDHEIKVIVANGVSDSMAFRI